MCERQKRIYQISSAFVCQTWGNKNHQLHQGQAYTVQSHKWLILSPRLRQRACVQVSLCVCACALCMWTGPGFRQSCVTVARIDHWLCHLRTTHRVYVQIKIENVANTVEAMLNRNTCYHLTWDYAFLRFRVESTCSRQAKFSWAKLETQTWNGVEHVFVIGAYLPSGCTRRRTMCDRVIFPRKCVQHRNNNSWLLFWGNSALVLVLFVFFLHSHFMWNDLLCFTYILLLCGPPITDSCFSSFNNKVSFNYIEMVWGTKMSAPRTSSQLHVLRDVVAMKMKFTWVESIGIHPPLKQKEFDTCAMNDWRDFRQRA